MNCIKNGKFTRDSCFGCKINADECDIRYKLVYCPRWIPVSEQIPGTKRVLITDGEIVKEGYCRPDGVWKYGAREEALFSKLSNKGVIAWTPLPEPFKPED